ncbi:hypothetical protein NYR55_00040 [Sphingomonas sp. BGYR3]|uniref:hypothetical protein n=1 Tax=Sphingomonas sp. BGYR3 TaxID=2975483 RepID=UPI0021A8A41C|nr:hypothetical protein [Sphingomonas sp. BGYR3]MDG5487017.1 hypothetical protein [Sphingomonas sp. BGYR3]
MQGSYSIEIDGQRNLARMTLKGFFNPALLQAFITERNALYARLSPGHVTLADVREMQIQSQEMVEAFRRMLNDPHVQSRKLAFVTASSLARMQLIRAAEARVARLFESVEAAERWLMSDDAGEPLAPNLRSLVIDR